MIVYDFGFSAGKWIHNDTKGIVRSCFRRARSIEEEGFYFGGENYVIGDKALITTGSGYVRTLDELIEHYPLFVSYLADKLGVTEDDTLVVGLPYDAHRQELGKKRRGLTNLIDSLESSLKCIKGGRNEVKFDNVAVFPQGLGGIKSYLADNEAEGNILGIDIGFNTVIYALYSCDEGELLTGKTYYKKGVHDLAVNLVMPAIQKHIGDVSLTPMEINKIVQTGKIQNAFDVIDVSPEIRDAVVTYVGDLLTLIMGDLKQSFRTQTFETVLLFGGGARLTEGVIKKSNKVKIVTLPEPEFANAQGFKIKATELVGAV